MDQNLNACATAAPRRFKLLKTLPDAAFGSVLVWSDTYSQYIYEDQPPISIGVNKTRVFGYTKEIVENKADWFKEILPETKKLYSTTVPDGYQKLKDLWMSAPFIPLPVRYPQLYFQPACYYGVDRFGQPFPVYAVAVDPWRSYEQMAAEAEDFKRKRAFVEKMKDENDALRERLASAHTKLLFHNIPI